jgi:hypothetical protein
MTMKSVIKAEGIEEVCLEIRSLNGIDTLFTSDGKMLANQCAEGHYFYIGENPRYKTFRTSFLVDGKKVDTGKAVS